jgi:hypothetical protein
MQHPGQQLLLRMQVDKVPYRSAVKVSTRNTNPHKCTSTAVPLFWCLGCVLAGVHAALCWPAGRCCCGVNVTCPFLRTLDQSISYGLWGKARSFNLADVEEP